MKEKRWLTLFINAENVHLTKDVGMIPYVLSKNFNYSSTLASYKAGEYPYLLEEVKGLQQSFIKRITGNETLDGLLYLLFNFYKYDILQVYHFTNQSLIWCYLFKILKLGKCKTYLKLDANATIKELKFEFLKSLVIKHIVGTIDLISVETKSLHDYLNTRWKRNIEYIPNGFYDNEKEAHVDFEQKENIILTVGRIGSYQKNSEVLCEAFEKLSASNNSWKLNVIGPIETEFESYINSFFLKNPELRNRISFKGTISDRVELYQNYQKAKIFVLTSRWEGFPLVFLEALRFGCFIISSDVDAALDITNNGICGSIFQKGNSDELSNTLLSTIQNPIILKSAFAKSGEFVYENFYWPRICAQIDILLHQ